MIDYNKFVENSRKWLKDYIQNNHLQSIVIGISGGIDSTVSCAIAYPVCKELNIPLIGRSLPTVSNHDVEIDTANLVGKAFCTNYAEKSIGADYIQLLCSLEGEGEVSKLQRGNIKARLRMIYLRHLASRYKGVVLDNDNFTEWNLGFWTIGGDSPMDINLGLHYLWKTEIYELANFLADGYSSRAEFFEEKKIKKEESVKCREQFNAIIESIQLTPTDGNGVSNSDCEQFGLDNYEQVDDVLKTMYHSNITPDTKFKEKFGLFKQQGIALINSDFKDHFNEYIRLIDSYGEQGVDKVILLHQNTAYKRKLSPIIPTKKELGL